MQKTVGHRGVYQAHESEKMLFNPTAENGRTILSFVCQLLLSELNTVQIYSRHVDFSNGNLVNVEPA